MILTSNFTSGQFLSRGGYRQSLWWSTRILRGRNRALLLMVKGNVCFVKWSRVLLNYYVFLIRNLSLPLFFDSVFFSCFFFWSKMFKFILINNVNEYIVVKFMCCPWNVSIYRKVKKKMKNLIIFLFDQSNQFP